jgi:hypothetical protein
MIFAVIWLKVCSVFARANSAFMRSSNSVG